MPLYTLYPCRVDGVSETFVTFDLEDDAEARARARDVLDRHPTASRVDVWCGERKVFTRPRMHPELRAILSRTN